MNKKTIGDLAEYVSVNFRESSMGISGGLMILSEALDSLKKEILKQKDELEKMVENIDTGDLDDYLVLIEDLKEKTEVYGDMFDITTEEDDLKILDADKEDAVKQ